MRKFIRSVNSLIFASVLALVSSGPIYAQAFKLNAVSDLNRVF
jgi:hypothetical protein